MNETLQHVRFEFDLLRLAMKLNPGDASAANDWMADVNEIEAALKNLRVTVTPSVPVLAEVLDRKRDRN
jgi:hypothetical protein